MFGRIGWLELVIILVIVIVILGPQRLTGAGKAIGKAIRDFRSSAKGEEEEESKPIK
jgi:sec-independent protein translocase protein TatA